ncbi:MAG TPA: hypothetical protein VIQ31_40280 [Phormidium sp.]
MLSVKTIAGDGIAKARASEFLPLNKSSSVTDDRTNAGTAFPRLTAPNPAPASLLFP